MMRATRGNTQPLAWLWGILLLLGAVGAAGGVWGAPTEARAQQLPEDILDAADELNAVCMLINPYNDAPVIAVGSEATPSETFAAQELAEHLALMTGRPLEIVAASDVPAGRKVIAVGKSRLTQSYDVASLGVEQYIIDITPTGVVIVGGREEPVQGAGGEVRVRDRGTLYGVYAFLERLGVRWYRPEPWGWHVPRMEAIELPVGRTVSEPPTFIGRSAVRYAPNLPWLTPEQSEQLAVWTARQRLTIRGSDEPRFGGQLTYIPNWHTHSRVIVPPAQYLKEHPEYFAQVNGERGNPGSGRLTQLCLGNPDLQEVFAQNVIRLARANPQWYLIPIDPEDGTQLGRRMCACDLCKAMDDPQNPTLMSNRVFGFTNIVARKVAAEMPDLKLALYAYSMHTQTPTLIDKLEPNVIVGLANINSWTDWTREMFDSSSPQNAQFIQLVRDWKAISQEKLWMREYSAYGWMGPIPMYRLLQDRVQAYRKLGMEALVWPGEHNYGPQMLLLYFKAQLQWNPDLNLEQELDLFYQNYYGPASKPMKAYHEAWMNAFENSRIGSGIQSGVSSGGRGMHLLCTPALMDELGGYLREARKLIAGDPLYERRLQGIEAGYEFARRVSEMLSLKLAHGEPTPQPNVASGKYLKAEEALQAWDAFEAWLAEANQDDWNFEIRMRDGKPTATALQYMKRDVLENGRYRAWNEKALLQEQGF